MADMAERLSTAPTAAAPRVGVLPRVGRFFLGDRVKRAHVSDHGALMRSLSGASAKSVID